MKHFFVITARVPLPADVMDQQKAIAAFMPAADSFRKAFNDTATKEKVAGVKFESTIAREKGDGEPKAKRVSKKTAATPASTGGAATVAGSGGEASTAGGESQGSGWTPGAGGAPAA